MARSKKRAVEYSYEPNDYQEVSTTPVENFESTSNNNFLQSEQILPSANERQQNEVVSAEVNESVIKPIGCGAVPITAPSQIIQLQPIVVPISFVPYASQNQKLLQYDKHGQPINTPTANTEQQQYEDDMYPQQPYTQYGKSNASENRVKSVFILILSLLFVVPFILAYFKADIIPSFNIEELNVLKKLLGFIGGAPFVLTGEIPFIALSAALVVSAVCFLLSLFTMIAGKYAKIVILILSCLSALLPLGLVIYAFVPSLGLVASNKMAFIVPTAIGVLQMVFAIAFAMGRKNKSTY